MMFTLRAVAAMLSLFAIVYLSASCLVLAMWRPISRLVARGSSVTLARNLYLLRVAPLAIAAAGAVLYELPSFLRFEPAGVAEGLSPIPLALSVLVLVAAMVVAWRMREACRRTEELCQSIASEATDATAPIFAVAGAIQQRMLVSQKAAGLLEQEELSRALAHETAHLHSRDNLRKLMLLACPFPGMRPLEHAWADAAEFAADERAVSSRREALALASAILKVASVHLRSVDHRALVTNFVGSAASTALRVQKLASWTPPASSSPRFKLVTSITALGLAVIAALSYPAVTYSLHLLTEFLFQ